MKLAIMQPYFFPYIGYFQLINYVDKFVVYDDVNFINKGWINRNRIILNDKYHYINLILKEKSQNKKINEIYLCKEGNWNDKLLKKIEHGYKKSPYFNDIYSLIQYALSSKDKSLSDINLLCISLVIDYLNIDTEILLSSTLDKDNSLKGQDKIINICKNLDADIYINPINGQDLYSKKFFNAHNIKLQFIKTGNILYNNYMLSIIDLMMNLSVKDIKNMLNEYIIY